MVLQHTVRNRISCKGIGLHTGKSIQLDICPADADQGITFERTDIDDLLPIKARFDLVSQTELATTLGYGASAISTIEHLMAALSLMKIDNARILVNGPEVPIMDGSAKQFVTLMRKAGSKEQRVPRKYALITKTVSVRADGDKWACVYPAQNSTLEYGIDFPSPIIGRQNIAFALHTPKAIQEVASARTFGFLRDVEYLKSKGLALGGGLDNAVVVDNDTILNPEGLRYPDECVRHKALDAIGDLALLGAPIIGRIEFYKGGHALHAALLKKIVAENGFQIVQFNSKMPKPKSKMAPAFHQLLSYA